jgi:hypothetical protein
MGKDKARVAQYNRNYWVANKKRITAKRVERDFFLTGADLEQRDAKQRAYRQRYLAKRQAKIDELIRLATQVADLAEYSLINMRSKP